MGEDQTPPAEPQAPPPPPVIENRVDKIQVVIVRTTYKDGRPVAERGMDPVVLFRAAVPDVWSFIDQAINGPRENPRP